MVHVLLASGCPEFSGQLFFSESFGVTKTPLIGA